MGQRQSISHLLLGDPGGTPVPGVPGDDHVVTEEEDAVEVDGAAGEAKEQVLPRVGPQQRHLVVQHQLTVLHNQRSHQRENRSGWTELTIRTPL